MNQHEFVRRAVIIIIIIAVVSTLGALFIRISPVLTLPFLAWVLSVGLSIPINALRRLGMGRGLATLLSFLGMLVLSILFMVLILPPFIEEVKELVISLPATVEAIIINYGNIRAQSQWASDVLPSFTLQDYNELLRLENIGQRVNPTNVVNTITPFLFGLGGFLGNLGANLFLLVLLTIYFVLDPLVYYRMVVAIVPKQHEQRTMDILGKLRDAVLGWFSATTVDVTLTAILVYVGLGVFLRIPNALALAVIAGVGNIIPYIGYWIAIIPILIFAAAQGPITVVLAFIVYIIIGLVLDNVVLPLFRQKRLDLPVALTIIFQSIAGVLLGFIGVLLAIPLLSMIIVLVRELYIFDTLGKRGHELEVYEEPSGDLRLTISDKVDTKKVE